MTAPRTFLAKAETLLAVKQRAANGDDFFEKSLRQLVKKAEEKLDMSPPAVVDKKRLPSSGDVHNYISLAPYWWPNPGMVDGLPYVRRDGEVNPERWQYDVTSLEEMTQAVRPLTFAYFFTDDERYAKQAVRLLRTWFVDPETRMNPNLEFAQFIPGRPTKNNEGHGIIETVRFRWLIDGVGLLAASSYWTSHDQDALVEWFRQFQTWLLTSQMGKNLAQLKDNKGCWYDMQVALYSLFVGDQATAAAHIANTKRRIATQIEPDGRQPAELKRTRSFHYSMYALQALFDLACLGDDVGIDLFNYATADERSLRAALDFLVPFAIGQEKWPYQQIDEPRWHIMAEILRRATVHFNEPKYEEVIRRLPLNSPTAHDATTIGSWLDLIEPPLTSD